MEICSKLLFCIPPIVSFDLIFFRFCYYFFTKSTQSHKSLQLSQIEIIPGADDQSWGWNLVDNLLLHNGDAHGIYPLLNNAPKYKVGERIRVILDCDDNTLSFEKNYEFLGVAFTGN